MLRLIMIFVVYYSTKNAYSTTIRVPDIITPDQMQRYAAGDLAL